jgi:MFS family permease
MSADETQHTAEQVSLWRPLAFRDFRLVWSAQILSELGDWAARVSLAVLVLDRTHSKVLTAAVTGVSFLPWVGIGQALAALGDRLPRRTVMVAADLVRAAAFLAMTSVRPAWALLTLAFVAACATPPFEAARAAMLPEVVSEDRYGDALTLSNITYQTVLVLGYLFGGGLVALVGSTTALTVNAATFAASSILLAMLSSGRVGRSPEGIRASIRAGARAIFNEPYLRRAAALATICGSCGIAGEALVAVYVRENLPAVGDGAIGILAATIPAGTITASLLVRRKGEHDDLLRTSALVVILGSIGGIIWFFISPPNFWAVAAYFSIGITFAVAIPAYAVVGSRLPDESRATGFGILQGLALGGQAIGSVVGGALAVVIGAGPAAAITLFPALGFALYAFAVPPSDRPKLPPNIRITT